MNTKSTLLCRIVDTGELLFLDQCATPEAGDLVAVHEPDGLTVRTWSPGLAGVVGVLFVASSYLRGAGAEISQPPADGPNPFPWWLEV